MKLTDKELQDFKLSQWIRLALSDLVKCETDSRYKINMSVWHTPNSHCSVCMAGSVMAKTLGADITEDLVPCDGRFDMQLEALDAIRTGDIDGALATVDINYLEFDLPQSVHVTRYCKDRLEWRKDMFKMARRLEAVGL